MQDRPFIEFIQSQRIAWESGLDGLERRGIKARSLSRDKGSGALSATITYPATFEQGPGYLSVDEEFFVLSGSLIVNEVTYEAYSYAHLPAGYHRSSVRSLEGAVVLTFFSGAPEFHSSSQNGADYDQVRLVERVSALEGEWGAGFNPKFPPGAGRKWLRRDPVTKDETWILGTMPIRNGFKREKHPVVEEMFLISGELHGPNGVMRPGAYFWRPPEEWHGPFGSLTGNVMLFRTVGGPLSTVYDDNLLPFDWFPHDNAILPTEMRDLPRVELPACLCY